RQLWLFFEIARSDTERALSSIFQDLAIRDIALFFQHTRDRQLHFRGRDQYAIMPRCSRIADTCEHIRDGISHVHETSSIFTKGGGTKFRDTMSFRVIAITVSTLSRRVTNP